MAKEPLERDDIDDDDEGAEEPSSRRPAPRSGDDRRAAGGGGGRRPAQGRSGGQRDFRPGGPKRGRFHRRKVCLFCADKEKTIDWKKFESLRRFIGDSGEIYPRRKSGLCARHQRRIAVAIKRARQIALLPYTSEHIRVMSK